MTSSLDALFRPRAIAVVGASRDPHKLGHVLMRNVVRGRFAGPVHPVNLTADAVLGRAAHRRIDEIDDDVDLALIVVPAAAVPDVIDDCARKRVGAAVVITAGFRETGGAGAALEREIQARARRGGVRLVGPNTVGIINTFAHLNATFAEASPLRQDVGAISQSGAVATAILDWARGVHLGFGKFVSLGNMADVTDAELIEYLAEDPETRILIAYFEGISDGRRFVKAARMFSARKPFIAMKVGRSAAGARAAISHTGSLAGSDAVVDGAFRQAGVIRAYTMDELFDYTLAFACARPPADDRVAVVTNAGGPGVMAADAIERAGLRVADLSAETRHRLAQTLPAAASTGNPIDLLGDAPADRYRAAMTIVLADERVDALIVLLTPQAVTEAEQVAGAIAHLASNQAKPLLGVFMGGEAVARGRALLDAAGVAAYAYPERAVRALAALDRYGRQVRSDQPG